MSRSRGLGVGGVGGAGDPDRVQGPSGGGAGLGVVVVSEEGPQEGAQNVGDVVARFVGVEVGAFFEEPELDGASDVGVRVGVVVDGVNRASGHGQLDDIDLRQHHADFGDLGG